MVISYDGTSYVGWQAQPSGLSVQQVVEAALRKVLRKECTLVGASRTDSGVHALGQVGHFTIEQELDPRRFLYGINALLPRDIRILEISAVDASFHAQYSAKSKLYYYHLFLEKEDDPFSRLYHTHFPYPLSLPLLEESIKVFVGTHDFSSFANAGSGAITFERTILRFDLVQEKGGVRFECKGSGFLYKMMRNMVGAAIDVARGKLSLDGLKEIFAQKVRKKAPPPAPARGLFLIKVNYPIPLSHTSSKEEK